MKIVSASKAASILRKGGVILAPTETVVGLISAEPGLKRLAEIKHRDPDKPVALLCATKKDAFEMASVVPAIAEELAECYWPGPLTLVLGKAAGGTVGVRVPDHEIILELLDAYGGPLYATSANLAGEPAPANLQDVDPRVANAAEAGLEGETGAGEASAVVDLSGKEARLLRANDILSKHELLRLVKETEGRV